MDEDTYRTLFRPRGISRDIAFDESRYVRIDRADPEWRKRLFDADPAFREKPNAAVRRIGKANGLVIRKHPVPLPDLDPIISQSRADKPHSQGKTDPHLHADLPLGTRHRHVEGRYHEGVDDPTLHEHEKNDGKYMMWGKPKIPAMRMTSHLNYKSVESLVTHLEDEHDEDLADPEHYYANGFLRPHEHLHMVKDPDKSKSPEKRLDMHPRAAAWLTEGRHIRRAFFVLEGTMKADALVSAGEIAFDVPSVTMWQAPELEDFIRTYLQDTVVYVVCDSDWSWNPQVAVQAFAARDAVTEALAARNPATEYGAVAQVAAPTPSQSKKPCEKHGRPRRSCKWCKKRGVDDSLGDGNPVDRMEVLTRELTPAFKNWKWHRLNTATHDLRMRKNEVRVLEWMVLHAADNGAVCKSAQQIARYTLTAGVKPVWSKRRQETFDACTTDTVHAAVRRLLAGGELESDDPLVHGDQFVRVRYPDGRLRKTPICRGEDWGLIKSDDGGRRLPEFSIRKDLRIKSKRLAIADFEQELFAHEGLSDRLGGTQGEAP